MLPTKDLCSGCLRLTTAVDRVVHHLAARPRCCRENMHLLSTLHCCLHRACDSPPRACSSACSPKRRAEGQRTLSSTSTAAAPSGSSLRSSAPSRLLHGRRFSLSAHRYSHQCWPQSVTLTDDGKSHGPNARHRRAANSGSPDRVQVGGCESS